MTPRTRILDAAMLVFRLQGFRRSSIEQAAEAAGLTRQALYHHFKSKEALFRAVIERLHESALAAEIEAANTAEEAGGSLADILVASVAAKLRHLAASLDGSPHVEELFSEHLVQARDLYQKYAAAYADQLAATVTRVCRKQRLALNAGMTPRDFARCVEMAINGTKSAYPAMQPADAFLKDLEIMLRTLVAGAVSPAKQPRAAKSKPARKSVKKSVKKSTNKSIPRSTSRKPGDRR
jgi:TetR/AcrR family acrAB operon transcriptional repressor